MAGTLDDARAALAATLAGTDTLTSIRPSGRASMPRLGTQPGQPALVLGSKLGEGGMAVVHSATQSALGREVAVKTSRNSDPGAIDGLVHEAWVTGALEHPNIVPVHDLGKDEAGRPLIVLKRIEGKEWSSLLRSHRLDENLQLLGQVCRAVSFAHSKGIVHRDLKPSNVMIGGFGEVYVVDWGIALPVGTGAGEVAGTLAYMAPEMLDGQPLTERADIYLLGAIIAEIMSGRPPHAAASVTASMQSIARSEPELPADAPEELAAIARRAMARDPDDRFRSVEELRVAVLGFLDHRGSAEVARVALERLDALEKHLSGGGERLAAYQMFGQCRFGFEEALRTWSANAVARTGRERALVAMATYELSQGDARAAALLVSELAEPRPDLAARLAELERSQAAKANQLAKLERDQDVTFGGGMRTLFGVGFALVWAALPVVAKLFPTIDVDHRMSLIVGSCSLAAIVGFVIYARRELMRTWFNRGAVVAVVLALVLHIAMEITAWALGLDMVTTQTLALAIWAGACGTAAVFLDRGLLAPTLGFLASMFVTLRAPEQRFWAMSVSLLGFGFTCAYIWYAGTRARKIGGLADLLKRDRN